MEESLAMPHVWVIEPSQREVNTPKLYRIIDLEKVESGGKKTNNQAQCVNLNISRGKHELEVDTSTSKQSLPDKSIDFATISLSDRKPEVDTLISKDLQAQSVLTVEYEATTVRSKDHFRVPTVEHEATTVSTEPELTVLTVESQDLTVENQTTTVSTKPESFVLTVENDTTEGVSDSKTQICNNRRKGKGTGRIQLRTITKQNGKQYQQFWYDWQVHTTEKTIYKNEA